MYEYWAGSWLLTTEIYRYSLYSPYGYLVGLPIGGICSLLLCLERLCLHCHVLVRLLARDTRWRRILHDRECKSRPQDTTQGRARRREGKEKGGEGVGVGVTKGFLDRH